MTPETLRSILKKTQDQSRPLRMTIQWDAAALLLHAMEWTLDVDRILREALRLWITAQGNRPSRLEKQKPPPLDSDAEQVPSIAHRILDTLTRKN